MATSPTKPVVLWILMVGLLVSAALATKVELEKRRLADNYAQAKASLAQLEEERVHLNEELTKTRQTVEDQSSNLTQLQTKLDQAEQEVNRLQSEQTRLQHANLTLTEQLAAASQAKQALEARLASIKELKKAIYAIKAKMWRDRWDEWLVRVRAQQTVDAAALSRGNRGLVVHNGVSTLGSKSKLQVRVLEPQAQ